eukprot:SAG31_NODE_13962_length_834_cov_1.598639_2_plen_133_part_01
MCTPTLRAQGYNYFTVDGGWFDAATADLPTNSSVPTVDEFGRPKPKPDLYPQLQHGKGWKPVADAAHSAGLKFGLWWILGVPTEAVVRKLPIKNSSYTAAVRVVTFSFLCPLLEKYGTFIARCNALIEKVSSF